MRNIEATLAKEFLGWNSLTTEEKLIVRADFVAMAQEEYDAFDATVDAFIDEENVAEAVCEYRRRIGGNNIRSYARTLLAGRR